MTRGVFLRRDNLTISWKKQKKIVSKMRKHGTMKIKIRIA